MIFALTAALTLGAPTAQTALRTDNSETFQITVDFFEGTIEGFFGSDDFPRLKACASDATDAYDAIKKAIGEIEEETFDSVLQGVKDLGAAYQSLKDGLSKCKAAETDITNFLHAVENGFEHPLSFVYHVGKDLIINHKQIFSEIHTAVSDWKAQSYRASGVQAGIALSKLLDGANFEEWAAAYGKSYASADAEAAARAAFAANADLVRSHHLSGSAGVRFHLNEYADLHSSEFNERNGFDPSMTYAKPSTTHVASGVTAPDSVDWRDHGLVGDVKNQGACGSCWAFSTVVSIEGQHAKANNGNYVSLSEQNLVDCVKGEKLPSDQGECCSGCRGGLMDDAFQYLIDHESGGIDTETAYPYTGRSGSCSFDASKDGASIGGWTGIKQGDEDALLDAVATVGPVSIAVDAAMGWQLYHGGIMHPVLCSSNPKKMDHGVAIVGYGTENGTDYWIIRNSWGANWGEKGYLRIVRGKNACGLANYASYPTQVTH